MLMDKFGEKQNLARERFVDAGYYNFKWAFLYLPFKVFFSFLVLILGFLLIYELGSDLIEGGVFVTVFMIATLMLPDMYLDYKKKHLQETLSELLPYLLDLMSVCIETGMTIEASMKYLSTEINEFSEEIAYLLKTLISKARMVGIENALNETLSRNPTESMRSFVFILKQSLKNGTAVSSVLRELSSDMREVQMLALEEKVGGLSAKMSVPLILFIMIPIVILIVAPGILRLLNGMA
jgi:tight adherence protein C